jgi:hypothetical protein
MADENTQQVSLTDDFSAAANYVRIKVGEVIIHAPLDVPVEISIVANGNAPAPQPVTSVTPIPVAAAQKEFIEAGDVHPIDGSICIAVDDRDGDHGKALFVPKEVFVLISRFSPIEQARVVAAFNKDPVDPWEEQLKALREKDPKKLNNADKKLLQRGEDIEALRAKDPKKDKLAKEELEFLEFEQALDALRSNDAIGHGQHDWRRFEDSEASKFAEDMKETVAPHVSPEFRSRISQDFWLVSTYGTPEQSGGRFLRAGATVTFRVDPNLRNWVAVVREDAARMSELNKGKADIKNAQTPARAPAA